MFQTEGLREQALCLKQCNKQRNSVWAVIQTYYMVTLKFDPLLVDGTEIRPAGKRSSLLIFLAYYTWPTTLWVTIFWQQYGSVGSVGIGMRP